MPARIRRSGVTTYDRAHQKQRAADLAAFVDGTLCPFPRCRQPMYRTQSLDWDHTYRCIAHAHCNRSDGARRGNARRGAGRALNVSRNW